MALHELQGYTLGQRKKHYNELVEQIIDGNHKIHAEDFNAADNDVINLLKIDVAGKKRNFEYILKILQGDDMLYVSRALKQCKWLFTDCQYSHIINPHYLRTQLFPNMTSKARAKLLLHIRIHLKDADRVEDFYNYVKEKDMHAALSWLPHCSLPFVELEVAKHYKNINKHLFKRLCEKSITILEIMIKYECQTYEHKKTLRLKETMFLLNREADYFLDIVETKPHPFVHFHLMPSFFGPKATSTLMKNGPHRILDKFEIYCDIIHLPTFAKNLKPEEIKNFICKICNKKNMLSWLKYGNLQHFVRYLPTEGRFDFIKTFLMNEEVDEEMKREPELDPYRPENRAIYQWYRFAPFKVAFAELTKLIRTISAPSERMEIFGVLLSCANRNPQDVQTILQYYNDRHINGHFDVKIQFVGMLLTKTDAYRFNETAWNTLNNIFYSMEVYVESENDVQTCIEAIILYKLLHNEIIPEIIKKKFKFQSMESIKKKLTDEESNKVFDFLYKTLESEIKNNNISSEIELTETVHLLENVQTLLTDWNKNLVDYPWFLDKVKELIKIKNHNSWNVNLSTLFTKKSWRRILFEESLMLSPTEETCYNALTHDPELMSRNKSTLEQLCRDDNLSLRRVLRALRVYWPQTLAADWMAWYRSSLDQPGLRKSVTRGLCILATQQQLIEILKKYAPTEFKIHSSEDNEVVLNIRKQLAQNMYVSRPFLSPDLVILYAKGDYLRFAKPSINAVFHNISGAKTQEFVSKSLDTPVFLQKNAIRFAFTKLEFEELKRLFHDIWKNAKHPSIHAVLFKQTYNLLCRHRNPNMKLEIWELLNTLIDNLATKNNKKIYEILMRNYKEQPELLRAKFIMKTYKFLKSFPSHRLFEDCRGRMFVNVDELVKKMADLIEYLDPQFVMDVLLESVDEICDANTCSHPKLMASYLLYTKHVDSQTEKYRKVLLPVLERAFKLGDGSEVVWNIQHLLYYLMKYFQRFVFEKNIVYPTKLFSDIQLELDTKLLPQKNYKLQTEWKLFTTYVKILEEHKYTMQTNSTESDDEWEKNKLRCDCNSCSYYNRHDKTKWNEIYLKALPDFSKACLEYLQEDVKKYFPTICWLFASCLEKAFFYMEPLVYFECLESLLVDKEFIPSYLIVLECTPQYISNECRNNNMKNVIRIREKIFSNSSPEIQLHYVTKYPRHEINLRLNEQT